MSYVGIGTSDPNHPLEVEGQVFISNVEQGSATNLVPFEVHSDYTGFTGDVLTGARQLRLRVTPSGTTSSNVNIDMGIEPTSGEYFYISNPVVDTALGSNAALRIVQAGHVEVGSNLSVSGNVVASNIIGGSPLTLSSDSLVKVAGSGGLSVTGPMNVDGTISQTGAVTGTSATYTGQVKAGTVSSTGDVLSDGTVSASPDLATTHILGKAKIGGTGGAARFGQYDFFDDAASWALSQGASGATFLNRATGQDIQFKEADSSTQMIIKSGGNIGVGTGTPTQKFEVSGGNIAIGQGYSFVGLRADDSVAGSITSNSEGWTIEESRGGSITSIRVGGNDIYFRTGTTPDERMRILSTGNVGIGTATPGAKLDVNGESRGATVSSTGDVVATGTITSSTMFVHSTGDLTSTYLGETPGFTTDHFIFSRALLNGTEAGANGTGIVFGNGATYGTDEISLITDGSTRMYVNSAGSIGINTTTPGKALDVNGTIRGTSISSSGDVQGASASLGVIDGSSLTVTGDVQGASASLGAIDGSTLSVSGDVTCQDATISGSIFHSGDTDTYLTFGTNIVDLFAGGGRRLRADSTGIAIGTNSASAPLHLVGDFNDTLRMQNEGRSDYFNLGVNNQNNFNIRNDAGTGVKLDNDATAWTVASDERVKKNITILENNLEKLSNIRPVSYHYNHDDDSREKRIGFIAQDWMGVQSEVVSTVDSYEYGIKYTETIPVLCGAIQELVARVAALENR